MKKTLISIATVLMGLTSGCKDEKLKECIGKVESLEEEFEELCEGDYASALESGDDLYHLVKKRDEVWKLSGCDQYQAKWVCKCNWDSEYWGSYHHYTELDYGRKSENKE